MIRCLSCHALINLAPGICTTCGHRVTELEGFVAFSPDPASANAGYDQKLYDTLAAIENESFWFKARNRILAWAIAVYCPSLIFFLEIGCGTGFVLSHLQKVFPKVHFHGSDMHVSGLKFAAKRALRAVFFQMDASNMPFFEEFDAIGAFDVLEHIENDTGVLAKIETALKPGGWMFLTVPQHRFMWGKFDIYSHHQRRYSRSEIEAKVHHAGFQMVRVTSFFSFLFPLMVCLRAVEGLVRTKGYDPLKNLRPARLVNKCFDMMMIFELICIKKGISFPFGGSLLLIAQKRVL